MRALGWLLIVVGMLIAGWGIYGALSALGQAYQHALDDPLGENDMDEKSDLPRTMLVHVAIGAVGVLPGVPGLILAKTGRARARRRAVAEGSEQ